LAAGEIILGKKLPSRVLHSVATASQEIGIGATVVDTLLTEAGAFEENDERSPKRKTFEAVPFNKLLQDIPTLVGHIEMQKAIGATRSELQTLAEDEVLLPRTRISTVKSPWSIADGLAFIKRMREISKETIPSEDREWITLQAARTRSRLSLFVILTAVEAEELTLGQRLDVGGYHSFVVKKDEIDHFVERHAGPQRTSDLVPAAAFGRTIGLRGQGTFLAFVSDGHTPVQLEMHPMINQAHYYMSDENIAEFRQKFLTPRMMADETGKHRNTVIAALVAYGAVRFMPNNKDYGPIYLRASTVRALASLRG
jgi:hypothetical protein